MKIVVTGGAGFIGANLCAELATRPGVERLTVLDDLSTGDEGNLSGVDVELIRSSILDAGVVHRVVGAADAVVHLAARPSVPRSVADPMASHHVNATGTMHVLEACREHGAYLVAASSSSVYGDAPALPKHEELPARPRSPYAASKLATEAYVLAYGATYRMPVLAFRFFNVYGELQPAGHAYAAVVPTFIDAALRGLPLPVYGDGRQTRDFTYVGSVVEVLADAVLRRVECDRPVNLAFGSRTSIVDLAGELSVVFGRTLDIAWQSERAGDVRDSQAADGLLRELFPDVSPVPLAVGLVRTVAWFHGRPGSAVTVVSPTGPDVVPLGEMASELLPALAGVELRAFRATADYDDEPWQIENFVRPLPGKTELSLVAMVAGAPVGFLVASRRPEGVHVHRLAVDPGHRREGIAAGLLTRLVAETDGTVTVVCHPDNTPALDLYLRAGFRTVGATEAGKVLLAMPQRRAEPAGV